MSENLYYLTKFVVDLFNDRKCKMILCDYFNSKPDLTWKLSPCCSVNHGVIRLPEDDRFDPASYEMVKEVIDGFVRQGITPLVVEPLPNALHDHIKLGDEKRDESIEKFIRLMENLSRENVNTVCFNFMAHYGWTRTSKNLPERGGALVTGFSLEEFKDDGFELSREKVWDNYVYFVKAVIPYAEKYGIKLALHPDDPPLQKLGGVGRIFTSLESVKRGMSVVDSENLGVTFCQACYKLMGEDLEEAISALGDKIFFVHFRNVRGVKTNFAETYHDNGEIDMVRVMRLYIKYCKDGAKDIPIRVDHVPTLPFESGNNDGYDTLGRLFAIGYLKGILDSSI